MRLLPLFLSAASAVVAPAAHAASAYDFAPVTQQIDALLSSHPAISGASLIVIRDGAPIYEEYFGDYTQTTRIPIASASSAQASSRPPSLDGATMSANRAGTTSCAARPRAARY